MKRIVFKDQDHGAKYDNSILNDFNDSDSDSHDNNNNNIKNESINSNIKNESINNSNNNSNKVNEKNLLDNKDNQSNPKPNAKPWNKWAMEAADSFDWNVFTNFGNKYKSIKSVETTLPTEESCDDNDSDKDEEELNF